MSKLPTTPRTRLSALAGLLGAAVALSVVTGAGPVPSVFQLTGATEDVRGNCDEAEHAGDPACAGVTGVRSQDDSSGSTSTTVDSSTSTIPGSSNGGQVPAGADVRTIRAADAGSVLVSVDGASLRLLTATPSQGWRAFVEQASGREVEVTFRSGTRRVDLNLELEDGQLRERVRTRDDATDTRTETTNGVASGDSGSSSGSDDSSDDNSGSGSGDSSDDDSSGSGSDDSSGPGSDDDADDNSGSDSDDDADDSSGSDSDDSDGDDNSGSDSDDSDGDDNSSGHGSDDADDDSSGSGSDDGPNHT